VDVEPERESIHTFEVPCSDGRTRHALVAHPGGAEPVPVVLSPHPMGFSAVANVFGEAAGSRTLVDVPGIWPSARRRRVAVVCVEAVCMMGGVSLGWRAHLEAFATTICAASAAVPLDPGRVVAAGLSMGGMESLLLAVLRPDLVRAVAVQNALTDLVPWFRHAQESPDLAEHVRQAQEEIGGTPDTAVDAFAARSPITHAAALAGVPVMMRYNFLDDITPATSQSLPFLAAHREAGGDPVDVEDLPTVPGPIGRLGHEHVDWPSLLDFCLGQLD